MIPYTCPSACGIWKRASSDGIALKKAGYDVMFFSSNILKGTDQKLSFKGEFEGLQIRRFPVKFKLGGSSMFYSFYKEFKQINPDIVHVHGYRHPHSLQGLILAKLFRKKVILTPHGVFKKDSQRSLLLKIIDKIYDFVIGWWELKLYNKIITIARWEESYLLKTGAKKSSLHFIPNGIDTIFLNNKNESVARTGAFYMGRLDPIKRLEWIKYVAKMNPNKTFHIHGPLSGYTEFKSQSDNLKVVIDTYSPKDFINMADSKLIFLLPSIRESFGIVALEAMARGCIVVSSNTLGVNEFIVNNDNGFIVNTEHEMLEVIKQIFANPSEYKHIQKNAVDTALKYDNEKLGEKLKELYYSLSN